MRSAFAAFVLTASPLFAQIQDNSFLIEEAYNQEDGVVQHIFTFSKPTRGNEWISTFTQEWPAGGLTNQLSYTIPYGLSGFGDVLLNYRYQAFGSGETRVACSPRASLIFGHGDPGAQVMLPLSTVLSPRFVAHWNLAASWLPDKDFREYLAGGSVIFLAHPRFNALLEVLWTRDRDPGLRESQTIVSPGVRWAYNLSRGLQIVPGIAFPVRVDGGGERSVFVYFSAEHPFR